MEDFSLGPVGRGDWYATKTANDPKRRRRHPENTEAEEEPVDTVVLSSEDDAGQTHDE